MRQLIAFGVAAAVLSCCGCDVKIEIDAKSKHAIDQEISRFVYVENIGPMVVASTVGTSASPIGPAGLNCLGTDQMFRMKASPMFPELGHVPSMFEVPDPNRKPKITTISRSNGNENRSDP
jgi:hypothetical protein